MVTRSIESKKERFNRVVMTRSWSVPLHIKLVIQNRRCWEDGLNVHQLLQEVKKSLRNNKYAKKANKLKTSAIYRGVSKINIYHEPPFYIDNQGRMLPTGKFEHRYFVPVTPEDLENARSKNIRQGTLKFTKEKRVRDFGDELHLEEEQKEVQQIVQRN